MKVAVSIPDPIFGEAESLASHMKTSRSNLYARALGEFIDRHAHDDLTQRINDALVDIDNTPDEFMKEAARQAFKRVEW